MSGAGIGDEVDFRQLVAVSGDAVVLSDAEGLIRVWNPAAERVFGFSRAEALGQSLDIIVPERHRKRHWDQYARTMSTGETRYGNELLRVPALRKGGGALSIAFTVGLMRDAGGAVSGVLAVIRDETSRWGEERALRARLAELESGGGRAQPRVEPAG